MPIRDILADAQLSTATAADSVEEQTVVTGLGAHILALTFELDIDCRSASMRIRRDQRHRAERRKSADNTRPVQPSTTSALDTRCRPAARAST
jgi:hypothetical protein